MNDNGSNDIAIIGMACVLPGAPDVRRYWENILHKVNAISDAPPEWEAELFYEQDTKADDRTYCKRGGFLGKRSEEHTAELQSLRHLVCRLPLEKKHTACWGEAPPRCAPRSRAATRRAPLR